MMRSIRFSLIIVAAAVSGDRAFGDTAIDRQQVPTWSNDDLGFFLHGSMSTEVLQFKIAPGDWHSQDRGHEETWNDIARGLPDL